MADDREPPALFDDEDNAEKDEEPEDLFSSAVEVPAKPAEPVKDEDDEKEDLFAENKDMFGDDETTEVPLDSPEPESEPEPVPVPEEPSAPVKLEDDDPPQLGVTDTTAAITPTPAPQPAPRPSAPKAATQSITKEEVEEEEGGDQFSIEISVTEPKKMGDGMNAYIAYKVNTKTTLPSFRQKELGVYRRFSDFLGLHDRLVEKHQTEGRIIPPPPEKSVIGMTKIKMSKEESGSAEFIEKRRAALERFLSRTAKHPVLRNDTGFREFLEADELPKSTSTSALSGAGVMRLFSKVGDSLGKMTFKMDETDQWFEEKQQQIEALDQQLRKLHSSIEALVAHRKELAMNTGSFAKSAAMLGNAEEHTALSRALAQLAEVEEKIDQLHLDQADSDFFVFSELIKDYIALIGSVKDCFHERVKIFKMWKEAEANLAKKREIRAKLELARKMDKIPPVSQEITEWENKVEKGQEAFETISKNIRKEVARFEKQRVRDFKNTIINYLESLMNSQQQIIKHWETFIPEAKAVA